MVYDDESSRLPKIFIMKQLYEIVYDESYDQSSESSESKMRLMKEAIKKFKEFALKLNKKKSFLNPYGLNISGKLKLNFEIEVNNFLNELTLFEYDCRTRINNFHDPLIKKIYNRLIWKFFDLNKSKMFFSLLEKDEFYSSVKKFHNNFVLIN